MVFVPLVYFALLEFGWPLRRVHWCAASVAAAWLFALFMVRSQTAQEIAAHWMIAAPASALAAAAVLRGTEFSKLRAHAPHSVRVLGWAFGVYALLHLFAPAAEPFPFSLVNAENFEAIFDLSPYQARGVVAVALFAAMLKLLMPVSDGIVAELHAMLAERSKHMRAILDAEPECVKVLDREGRLLDMNAAGLNMVGAPRFEDVRGASVFDLVKPVYHDAYKADMEAAFCGETTRVRFEIVGLNGIHRYMDQTAAPLPGAHGKTDRIVAITRDITESIKAERALAQNKRMLEQAQRIGDMGSWEWNIVTNELTWSDQIYRIFGLSAGEFGASYAAFLDCVHPDDRAQVEESVRRATYEREPYDIRHRIVRPSGEVRIVRERGEVEYGVDGSPQRMLGAVLDITDFCAIEEALRVSQEKMSGILRIAPEAIIVTDGAGAITMFSNGAERIFGYDASEVIGRDIGCLLPERFRSGHSERVRSFITSPRLNVRMGDRESVYGVRKEGEEFPVMVAISKLVTSSGVCFMAILRDVTAEQKARAELLAAKEQAELANKEAEEAQRAANLGTWEWRLHDGSFRCSAQVQHILGRTPEEVMAIEGGIAGVTHAEDFPLVVDEWQACVMMGHKLDVHHRVVRPDGEERFIHTQGDAIRDAAGAVVKVTGVMRDVTELRSTQDLLESLRAAGEQARAESAAKTNFLSSMSHELRTPLNAIIGYSEMMLEAAEDEARDGDVTDHNRVILAARHLLKLINELLDLSKIEAGRMEAEVREYIPGDVAAIAADTVRPTAETNGNRLVLELAENLGAARGDSFRLSQCLLNLLSNAAKFTENGVITLRGRREHSGGCDWLMFDVEDTGAGMTEDQLARLFTPFVQGGASVARTHGGTGLGLVITQRLARLLGGDIFVHSTPGKGSVFTLRLIADLDASNRAHDLARARTHDPAALPAARAS
jgi:PAS domain S-box-containing protein